MRARIAGPLLAVWLGFLIAASLWSLTQPSYWGVTAARTPEGDLVVTKLDPFGLASPLGVRVGDTVIEVNGAAPTRAALANADHFRIRRPDGTEALVDAQDTPGLLTAALLAGSVLFASLGILVHRWTTDIPLGRLFLVFTGAAGSALAAAPAGLLEMPMATLVAAVAALIMAPACAGLFAAFPRPIGPFRFIISALAGGTAVMVLTDVLLLANGAAASEIFGALSSAWIGGNFVLASILLLVRMRHRSDRSILAPLVGGVVGSTLPLLAFFVVPWILGMPRPVPVEVVTLALLAIPASFAYAILRHRLFALDAILRRHAVTVGTALIVALLFSIGLGLSVDLRLPLEVVVPLMAIGVALSIPAIQGRVAHTIDAWLFPPLLHARDLPVAQATSAGGVAEALVVRLCELLPVRWAACYVPVDGIGLTDPRWQSVAARGEAPLALDTVLDEWAVRRVAMCEPVGSPEVPIAWLVVGPRSDGTRVAGVDAEVLMAIAHQVAPPLQAALLRDQVAAEDRFRSGVSDFVRDLSIAASVADVLEVTTAQARTLLEGSAPLDVRVVPATTTGKASQRARRCLLKAGVPTEQHEALLGQKAVAYLNGKRWALAVALGGDASLDACLVATRPSAETPFTARDLARAVEIAQHASAALRRAVVAAQASEVEALREVDRVRLEFLDMVSHDLQNPLTIISGFAEMLDASGDRLGPDLHNMVRSIRSASRTSSQLVHDLLTAARLERGRLMLHAESLNLTAFLSETAAGFQALSDGSRLTVEAAPGLRIRADPLRLEQMVTNLVSNALRYAPGSPVILRAHSRTGQQIVIEVEDHGPGIPAEDLPHVWEKFYRGVQSQSKARGTGLGLALVKSLAELHGGLVELESTEGKGSTFRIVLPSGADVHDLPRAVEQPSVEALRLEA